MMETDAATLEQPLQVISYRDAKPKDYRCPHCARLLMRAVLVTGCYIEIRCSRCAKMCVLTPVTFTPSE